ncbi:MFS transporter [Variovorax sp. WS11]|uniref:MFS transporter n=2 Tax=Variovorax sp. WS11 TaxID=1105204 RepID=UPI000D0D4E0E|nr:MFS transporter [Variovorax sp. WS11]NDZ17715.1 MFS transporter [Variovorax sp. WS11]PSL80478.1 MFS transporter [Variovorax sp. WS11]
MSNGPFAISKSPKPLHPYVMWMVLLAAGGAFALSLGVRNTMGLYLSSLNTATGLGVASISLAFAFGQLWWGLTQPFAGAVADRIGAGRVIVTGLILIAIGTVITPYMTTTLGLIFSIGVLGAGGAGMAGPSVLMAASTRLMPASKRGISIGIVNAGGSFGQFAIAPVSIALTASIGWASSMQWMGLLVLLALPAAWLLRGNANAMASAAATAAGTRVLSTREVLALALKTPSYLLLAVGFLVCGFHVAFLATHLPGVVEACGMSPTIAGWALALVGLFNMFGSLAMGWAVGRWRMKSLLSLLYTVRGLGVLVFVLAPKTPAVMLIFAALMGLTFLSTVPPTVGLVAKMFGPANMAMLYGVLMLGHQLGGFLGAFLGGQVFALTGGYDWVWYMDLALAAAAALIHLPIREAPLARSVRPAAA